MEMNDSPWQPLKGAEEDKSISRCQGKVSFKVCQKPFKNTSNNCLILSFAKL